MTYLKKININNEYGSIGEKIAANWLNKKFNQIMKLSYDINLNDKKIIDFFGEKLDDMIRLSIEARESNESKFKFSWEARDTRFGMYPDFIIKHDHEIFFVEVKVNKSKPNKFQKVFFELAKKFGFKVFILNINIQINVVDNLTLIEF